MNFSVSDIRSKFIDYFVKNSHSNIQASPLIPHNDPTMMFVNSGMVQFKNVFTGVEKRDYTRATSCQKSVRAGGKHNDLENVGYTARHHTFFEMLGNFSFGDYFKEEAIYYAWNLLTKEFGLPKEKLYATVYHTDDEAANYWKKIASLDDSRIIRINTNDNFWSMGDTGPCGPCSEIFFDHGDHIPGGLPGTADQDGDRYIEIWNMVFMQYEQVDKDTRIDLPKKSIDTGMGLERIAAVLQGVHDNYDIDLFKELIATSEDLTKTKSEGEAGFSHRVIADHLRSSSFLIADGVMPSNEGRGYVLRRIMRRAMRHAHQLGAKEPLMYRLLPKLVSLMGEAYPELKRAEAFVTEILKTEEERFKTTLDRGLKLLEEESSGLKEGEVLSGEIAFKLYDTYGFPVDLTEDILKKKKITIDQAKFVSCMDEQKDRARKSWVGSGESKTDKLWFGIKEELGSTEFLGYSLETAQAVISSLIVNGEKVDSVMQGQECTIITNQTPFYGESGGQMGDIGVISGSAAKARVNDTKKYLGAIIGHVATIEEGKFSLGDVVELSFDVNNRNKLRANHSATHILHGVLRDVLGNHITQKGSLVAADKLRFDISHPKSLSLEEISVIERKVNEIILQNSEVITKLMPIEEAIKTGAMALFGEKYDDEVRVISMGLADNSDAYSIELCGGTHVRRTGDIGLFKIVSESAIAAGVRRIEAVTGLEVLERFNDAENYLNKIAENLKSAKPELLARILELLENKKLLEKENQTLKQNLFNVSKDEFFEKSEKIDEYKIYIKFAENLDPKAQRVICEEVQKYDDNGVFIFISDNKPKSSIVVSLGAKVSQEKSASDMVKLLSAKLGGAGGGGNAKLAQAGGSFMLPYSEIREEVMKYFKQS